MLIFLMISNHIGMRQCFVVVDATQGIEAGIAHTNLAKIELKIIPILIRLIFLLQIYPVTQDLVDFLDVTEDDIIGKREDGSWGGQDIR